MAAHERIVLDTTAVASKEQAPADLGDEAAPRNHKDGVYCGLDPVEARIWKFTQTPHTVREVAIRFLWSTTLTAASGTVSFCSSSFKNV